MSQKMKHALIARTTSDLFRILSLLKPLFAKFNLPDIFWWKILFWDICFNGDIGTKSSGQMRLFPAYHHHPLG